MANINNEIQSIINNERGEDVRDAFISACRKIAEWQLPSVTVADADKVLSVNSSGKWGADSWT